MDGECVSGGINYPVAGEIRALSMLLEGGFRQRLEELGFRKWCKRADFASGRVIEDAEREKIPSG